MVEELFLRRRDDKGVPLLTEIILENELITESDLELNQAVLTLASNPQAQPSDDDFNVPKTFESELASSSTEKISSEGMAVQITEQLTQHVQLIIESTLEDRLSETMRVVLEQNMAAMRTELNRALTQAAHDAIAHVVRQEIQKITLLTK